MSNNILDWALFYANKGWHVFPIVPGEKRPLTTHGVKDATANQDQIKNWWLKWPKANIAVACGMKSGIYAVDVDIDVKTGTNGWKSMEGLPSLPRTICQNTPRGGCHLFFTTHNPLGNKTDLLRGVDVRGEGGYVLLAPSVNKANVSYSWIPDQGLNECPIAEYPDFLRSENLTNTLLGGPGVMKPVVGGSTFDPRLEFFDKRRLARPPDGDLARAAAYLRECDPAVQGDSGHDKLLWAAVAMVHKFKLSDSDTLGLLVSEFNPRCDPPWDLSVPSEEKDFRRKVSEARKLTPRESYDGFLDGPEDCANVDIVQILANHADRQVEDLSVAQESHSFRWTGTNEELYDYLIKPSGLLGAICAWVNATAYRPQPMLTLACSLTFFGTIVGRRICGEDDARTNLYCIGVAPSSAGKSHAMNKIRQLSYDAGCDDRIGGGKFASDSAIERRLSENPATMFIVDEIGHMLKSFKDDRTGHKSGIVALLMELYSMSNQTFKGKEYATQEQRILVQPCCSLYGVSEPTRFAQSISTDEIKDGWIARCMIFDVGIGMPEGRDVVTTSQAPQDVIDRVSNWETLIIQPSPSKLSHFVKIKDGKAISPDSILPNMIEIPYSDGAKIIFKEMDTISIRRYNSMCDMGPVWMKSTEKAKRVSLILAASENPDSPCVSADNAAYACRLVSFLLEAFTDKVLGQISSNHEESMKQRLLFKIQEAGSDGIGKSDLTRRTQWAQKTSRDHMLADLVQGGFIVIIDVNKRDGILSARHSGVQSKRMWYWAIEHYNHSIHGVKNELSGK